MNSPLQKSLPEDVSYMLAHFDSPKFGGNGYLTLVAASLNMIQHQRIHAASVSELSSMVMRDAHILLGGRAVGVVEGIRARGEEIPDTLQQSTARIVSSLDKSELNMGVTDPSRSVWRQVAARGRKEAFKGYWSTKNALAMQVGVLGAKETLEVIGTGFKGQLRRSGVEEHLAADMANMALALLAYGEFSPDIANFPLHRSPAASTARTDMAGALAYAAEFDDHPARRQLDQLLMNASIRFRIATLRAMSGNDPAFRQGSQQLISSQETTSHIDKTVGQY